LFPSCLEYCLFLLSYWSLFLIDFFHFFCFKLLFLQNLFFIDINRILKINMLIARQKERSLFWIYYLIWQRIWINGLSSYFYFPLDFGFWITSAFCHISDILSITVNREFSRFLQEEWPWNFLQFRFLEDFCNLAL
jgi:hypothetical protein